MLQKYYLGGFFRASIPNKRYQNTSGFAGEIVFHNPHYSEAGPGFPIRGNGAARAKTKIKRRICVQERQLLFHYSVGKNKE